MTGWIDLNADLGEGALHDAQIMALVSSCNIACGGHAGDSVSMTAALKLAKTHKVCPGAHPSFPDREGFGRRPQNIDTGELNAALTEQIEALKTIAASLDAQLTHLKPHGALYNQAASDAGLSGLLAHLTKTYLPGAYLVGPPGSALSVAANAHAIGFLAEGFADRAYTDSGALVPRGEPGAVLATDAARTAQALSIATNQSVTAISGKAIALPVQTLCLHGDSDGALSSARSIRAALTETGLTVRAPV